MSKAQTDEPLLGWNRIEVPFDEQIVGPTQRALHEEMRQDVIFASFNI